MADLKINSHGLTRLNSYLTDSEKKSPCFKKGDVFYSLVGINQIDKGVVNRFRDDKWERQHTRQNHYSVTFDDGSSEAYQSESMMIHLKGIEITIIFILGDEYQY